MTSLSSRKSWDILALSIEKIDFLIFSYFKLRVYLWALIHKRCYVRSRNCNFFWILHSWINNPTLALFWFRPHEFSYMDEKKIWLVFHYKGGPLPKKSRKFFLIHIWKFIHQSIALVEFGRNILLLNFFELISSQNSPKNSVKIRLFIGRFKKSCFWP